MATERDLIAAILTRPDEDTPRLAYADWLDEQGGEANADRAAFIRHQLDRANNPDAVPSPDDDAGADRLDRLAWASWLPALPAWAKDPRFHRGFVEEVTCTADDFIARADELFATAPVRRLRFHAPALSVPDPTQVFAGGAVPDIASLMSLIRWRTLPAAALAACPHLSRVRSLEIGAYVLSASDLRLLLDSPHLREVVELSGFHGNLAADDALGVVARSARLASLRKFRAQGVVGGTITAAGVRSLAASPHVRQLRSLTLSSNGLGDNGARALAASPVLRTVTTLWLDDCRIGPAGVEALTASANLGPLARLSLSSNRIGARGAAALGRCERLRSLRELSLHDCMLDEDALPALFGSGVLAGLRRLYLGSNQVRGVGASALAAEPFDELHTLDLRIGWTRAEALTVLAAAPWLRALQNLNLDGNKFDVPGMVALAAAPLDSVRVLDLTLNCLGDEGAAVLAAAPWLRGVRRLSVNYNAIGEAGAVALANSPHLTSLEHFSINGNPLGLAGVRALLDSPVIPPDTTIYPEWGWYEEDERAKVVAELAKYGDRVSLPDA